MNYQILQGDCIETMRGLPSGCVQTCVTSPPYYGLRDYGHEGQIGLEDTPDAYVAKLVDVFREVKRVLRDDGTLWLNLGDSYNGSGGEHKDGGGQSGLTRDRGKIGIAPGRNVNNLKPKDLIGIPWLVAFALRADGWYLRSDIIWHKPNPMPESVTDRPTKAHEYIFLLSKSREYFYDADAIAEASIYPDDNRKARQKPEDYDGMMGNNGQIRAVINPANAKTYPTRNRRSVWTVTTKPYAEAHFATFPPDLIEPCILAGSKVGDTVLDPFNGSGTTGAVALKHGRKYIGCELNPEYIELAHTRIRQSQPMLFEVTA
jgi:DNA modification methylase